MFIFDTVPVYYALRKA